MPVNDNVGTIKTTTALCRYHINDISGTIYRYHINDNDGAI